MTKVWCPCLECVNNKDNRCRAKELRLTNRNMATVNEGRVDMWVCDQYVVAKEYQDMLDGLNDFVKKRL